MSIVYELVEWIRWMFSLNYCIYLIHENSVIHELEDIQLLSELKNFEIVPCGERFCAHKKIYRTLLENLNLFVSWNDMKVHKYFLDKINQMSQKLNQSTDTKALDHSTNATIQNLINFNTDTDSAKKIVTEENNLHWSEHQNLETNLTNWPSTKKMRVTSTYNERGDSSSIMTSSFDKKTSEKKEGSLFQHDDTFSLSDLNSRKKSLENKKSMNISPNKSSFNLTDPNKKKCTTDKESNKNHTKPWAIKPFSVGEFLSVIRKDLEEKSMDVMPMENTSQNSAFLPEERNSESKINVVENSFALEDEVSVKKRQRTRKRKKSKKQHLENEVFNVQELEYNSFPPLNIVKSNCNSKPHHIRFEADDDDEEDIKNSDSIKAPGENEFEVNCEPVKSISTLQFLNNDPEELTSVLNDADQNALQKSVLCSSDKNNTDKMECLFAPGNEITEEKKGVNEQDDFYDKVNQLTSSPECFQLNNSNHDLNDLLSLRAKYKNGIVIQRF